MDNFKNYRNAGFEGFKTVEKLMTNVNVVPNNKGVYMVLRPSESMPNYVEQGTGGFFKRKNPNVSVQTLAENWVKDADILYIGKAGGTIKKKNGTTSIGTVTLRERITLYMRFGQGKPVAHWGGRLIWQLEDAKALVICWKVLKNEEPREVEKQMIQAFKNMHDGRRPFANLQD